jgi:hypothetical protein
VGIWRSFRPNGLLQAVHQHTGNTHEDLERYDQQGNIELWSKYDTIKKIMYQYQYSKGKLVIMSAKHANRSGIDVYEYYSNGAIKAMRVYDTTGGYSYKTFYENSNRESEAYYKKEFLAHGKQQRWYRNGQLQMEAKLVNGYAEGEWVNYNADGSIVSKAYYIKGIEQVKAPANDNCFCNRSLPAIMRSPFYDDDEPFMPLKSINAVMHRFKLDTFYSFVRCHQCYTTPIIAVLEQKLLIDNDGMYLNLTPCMQGYSKAPLYTFDAKLHTVTGKYHDYENEDELLAPINLVQFFERIIAVYSRGNDVTQYQQPLEDISGDSLLLYRLLRKHYGLVLDASRLDVDQENEAIQKASDKYEETKHGDIPFDRHFAAVLTKAILPYFPAEAKILAKDATNREAISSIFRKFFVPDDPMFIEQDIFGSMEVGFDSGTVVLTIPASFIAAYDTLTNKKLMVKGKPMAASFMINFSQAYYHSYPADNFSIPSYGALGYCAKPFTIANTNVWINPYRFQYALGKAEAEEEQTLNPLNYPAHYKNLHMVGNDMDRHLEADLDTYIQQFMGVVVKEASMHIPGMENPITITETIIDAKEINGCIKQPQAELGITEAQLGNALMAAGFRVFYRQNGMMFMMSQW